MLVKEFQFAEILVGTFDVDSQLVKVIIFAPELKDFIRLVHKVLSDHVLLGDEASVDFQDALVARKDHVNVPDVKVDLVDVCRGGNVLKIFSFDFEKVS